MKDQIVVEKQSSEVAKVVAKQFVHEFGETVREMTKWRRFKRECRLVLLAYAAGYATCLISWAMRVLD